MKKEYIKFSLNEYFKGPCKAETLDGRSVILYTGVAKSPFPIHGCIEGSNRVYIRNWKTDGTVEDGPKEDNLRLLVTIFEDGDILATDTDDGPVTIFKKIKSDGDMESYVSIDTEDDVINEESFGPSYFHLATSKDIDRITQRLKKTWNLLGFC